MVHRRFSVSKRPFLVLPGGVCVPLEGEWRTAELRGEWYVLGHNSVVPCGSERAALSMLAQLQEQTDIDVLASEAIEGLDRIPESWETDSLGEASLR
jgi:hypothetical protein